VYAGAPPQGAEVWTLPAHEDILADPGQLMRATLLQERQVQHGAAWAVQEAGGRAVTVAPPAAPLDTATLDALYLLPFSRRAHPSYDMPVPAEKMIRHSVTSHRGCGGGCSFCALALHQGRRIRSRSRASILAEVERMAASGDWKGGVSDVGGPSANMWNARCQADPGACRRTSCLFPRPCKHFAADQRAQIDLLRAVRDLPGVKHVRVASGVRMDLALQDPEALRAWVGEFVGGQLKVAPEHVSDAVLRPMRKPGRDVLERFLAAYARESALAGKEQYVVPYLMSGFPGCTDEHMRELKAWLDSRRWKPRQVQCFIPLPGTVAAAMFHAGVDEKGKPLPVAREDAARLRQHAILVPREPGATGPGKKAAGGRRPGRKPAAKERRAHHGKQGTGKTRGGRERS
jgi:uncharacterized radical SAM protein YgiQ